MNKTRKSQLEDKTFDKQFAIYFTVFIILVLIVLFIPWVVQTRFSLLDLTTDKAGHIGDSLGGTLGPFIALIAAGLTFLAFWVQFKANEQQRIYLKKQRFEDTFFRLLENHQRIVEAMDLISYEKEISKRLKTKEVDEKTFKSTTIIASNRDCFRTIYKEFARRNRQKKDITSVKKQYGFIQNEFKSDLHHYYRFIYRVLKFVKESDIPEDVKYNYTSIFRAVFSPYELVMLFYNGLHDYGEKLHPIMEEFSFLKNMDRSLLIDVIHKDEYDPVAMPDSSELRLQLLADWKAKQL